MGATARFAAALGRLLPRNAVAITDNRGLTKEQRIFGEKGALNGSLFGRQSHAGRRVTIETAMEHSAVWACVRQTSQNIASLPLPLYEKSSDGTRSRVADRYSEILSTSPNSEMTGVEFWEGQIAWLLSNGNCYSEIVTTGRELTALRPIQAHLCEPIRQADGRLAFEFADRGKTEVMPADKVLHIKGFGFGGMKGLSAIRFGVHSLGAGLAADESAARFFDSGLSPSGVLKTGQTLNDDQRDQLQALIDEFSGSRNHAKTLLLEAGIQWDAVSLNPEDAQLLETRRFSIEDICRWFGVPPIVIGHAGDGQTMWGSGVEQILIAWMSQGLNPLMRRIEASLQKSIFSRFRPGVTAEWTREGILQMDSKAKAEFLRSMVVNGIMTPNEARAKLNLPPIEGGGQLYIQGGMIPLDEIFALASRDTGD